MLKSEEVVYNLCKVAIWLCMMCAVLLTFVSILQGCSTATVSDIDPVVELNGSAAVEGENDSGQTRIMYVKRVSQREAENDRDECRNQAFALTDVWLDFNREIFRRCMFNKGYQERVVHIQQ